MRIFKTVDTTMTVASAGDHSVVNTTFIKASDNYAVRLDIDDVSSQRKNQTDPPSPKVKE